MDLTSVPSAILRSVTGGSLPSQADDRREFTQERLALFAQVILVLGIASLALRLAIIAVATPQVLGTYFSGALLWVHLGFCAVFAGIWQLARRRVLRPFQLVVFDAVAILSLSVSTVLTNWLEQGASHSPHRPLLAMATLLTFRALLVPSRALWTLVLSSVAIAPAAFIAYARVEMLFEAQDHHAGWNEFGAVVQWIFLVVAISTISSHVVYNLRRKIHEAGQVGPYTLEKELGKGGMGVVYKARHALLKRPTAVKLLRPEIASESSIARFEKEVQSTSELSHPNTISVYDYGLSPDGHFYYAMEYLDGLDLDTFVEEYGELAEGRALYILDQVAASLTEAHEMGFIHRDVKPANIMLCTRGGLHDVAKVLDFGLVRRTAVPDDLKSTMDSIKGTPHYLSPEAIQAPGAVDARSDLYALGGVAYVLLTSETLFDSENVIEVCGYHLSKKPVAPSERLGKPIAKDFEDVILKCLEKDADARYQSARELRLAFRKCESFGTWTERHAAEWWRQNRGGGAASR